MGPEVATPGVELPESWLRRLESQDPVEARLLGAGFRALLAGRSVAAPELAAGSGLPAAEVRERLAGLAAQGLVELDDRGTIVGCKGLSLRPTSHRLQLGGRDFYTWCAVDAIGIPAALEADARIESRCAGCGRPLGIDVAGGVPVAAAGEAVRVWVADIVPGRAMAGDT